MKQLNISDLDANERNKRDLVCWVEGMAIVSKLGSSLVTKFNPKFNVL